MENKAEDKTEGKKPKVRILFKSGSSIDLEVDKFSVTKTYNDLTSASWENSKPRILFLSLSDVEGIFELEE